VYQQLIVVSQGVHNIFVVIPQFLMTGLSSIVFAISEPDVPVLPGNKLPVVESAGNVTLSGSETVPMSKPVGTNSVAIIFRYVLLDRLLREVESNDSFISVGGVSALIAMVLWDV
jgi:solute carrier family 45 protein 1/2/4